MSTFAKTNFKSLNYASFRPPYPVLFYNILLTYTGKESLCNTIDLGCGTGVATFPLLNISKKVTGLDLSPLMIEGANQLKSERLKEMQIADESRIEFRVSAAEDFEAPPASFDMIVAAECIHWFKDFKKFFHGAARQLQPGGTLAYWYYVDHLIVDFSGSVTTNLSKEEVLSKVQEFYTELMYTDPKALGTHWEQPGWSVLKGFEEEVDKNIPLELFTDVKIQKYIPDGKKTYTDADLQMVRQGISLIDYTNHLSTYSAYHSYHEATGKGPVLLESFIERCEKELGWSKTETKLSLEWSTGYTFMKKKVTQD